MIRRKKYMKHLMLTVCLTLALPLGQMSAANNEPAELDADVVEYDASTGLVTATGDVLFKQGTAKLSGAKATYNAKTQEGSVEGNVIAIRDDLRVTCAKVVTDGQGRMTATGNVHGTHADKEFTGEQVDYYPNQNKYVKIPLGGTVTNKDGTFKADYMEGWLDDEHYIGRGNVYISSPVRMMEAGGDNADYQGKQNGQVVLSGNAWATKENNRMRSKKLTLYLANDGTAQAR
ncbi:LptA/OstA family protein [Selenomonas sp. AE3005]|uniref:LptA/OstA family protein n=1 Tax=Selenomonas sp. AE3005 TaxID=1485543 RepID=UPI000483E68B|nr:LptA/OstA family protein [Selenomonas sp. AE3005]